MNVTDMAAEVLNAVVCQGGGTFRRTGGHLHSINGEHFTADTGWVVAIPPVTGENVIVDSQNYEHWFDAIENFLLKMHNPSHLFGVWADETALYVDHVVITDLPTAEHIGRSFSELALFNLVTGNELSLTA